MRRMKLTDIKISEAFANSIPSEEKMNECRNNWNQWNRQDRYIVVNPDNVLIDGYIQYLVLKENNVEEVEVKISTKRKKRWYRKNVKDWNIPHYKNEATTYIYGTHPNSKDTKTYMWRVPKSWTNWTDNIQIGDTVMCATKFGYAPVIVSKIEILDKCPIDISVKKVCSKQIRRNGMVVEIQPLIVDFIQISEVRTIKIEENDRVVIISNCNSKGQKGTVLHIYWAGYCRHCRYVMVQLDNGTKQGYNDRSVRKINNESEDTNMEGFKNVAIVNLLDDYNKKDYGFALYDNELGMIQTMAHYPAMVVVNARGKDNRILGIVKEIMPVEEYGKGVTAQVVGVVNMDGYIARVEEENRLKELAKKKAAIEKELEAEINKRKSVEYYEEMAKKYSDNPKLAELVAELKGLGE